MRKKSTAGFTLVELMVVTAIIGILATIALPHFTMLVAKSHEATTKGNIGVLRTAINLYYIDTQGLMPGIDLAGALTTGAKYLRRIPPINLPKTPNNIGHAKNSTIVTFAGTLLDNDVTLLDIYGYGWIYKMSANAGMPVNAQGYIYPSCSHRDLQGRFWTTY